MFVGNGVWIAAGQYFLVLQDCENGEIQIDQEDYDCIQESWCKRYKINLNRVWCDCVNVSEGQIFTFAKLYLYHR